MQESMILSIYITATNMASGIFRQLGMDISGANGVMGLATAAAVGLGAAVVGVGVASVKAATSFQTQFARISGLTGSSAQMIDYYKQKILELSPTWDLSASDAAKALYFIISAGFSGAQAIDILNYSAKSATASLADQATVADALTSMMNAYKDSNVSASVAANDLTKIEVYGKATLSAFASSLGFTMVTAHAAGLQISEASAAVATLSQVSGQHGIRRISMEFDNLARSLLSIDDISKRSAAQLKAMGIDDAATFQTIDMRAQDMGITFDKLKYSGMDFIGKLQYLAQMSGFSADQYNSSRQKMIITQYEQIEATKGQTQAQAWLNLQENEGAARFMKMVGGAAAFIPALILLSGKSAEYNKILAAMKNPADVVTAAFNNMRNTFGQQMKMFEIRLQNIGIVIGMQLLPYLSKFVKGLIEVAGAMLSWVQVPAHFALVASAVKGLAIILGAMLLPVIVHLVIASLPFLAMLAAMVIAAIAVGKAFDFVTSHWKQFVSFLSGNTWQALAVKAVLIALTILMVNLAVIGIAALVEAFIAAIPFILLSIAMMWGLASAVIAATWPFVLAGVAIAAFVFAILMLVTHWKQVAAFLVSIWNNIGVTARNIWGAISGFFVQLWQGIVLRFQLVWSLISGFLASVWRNIVATVVRFALDFVNALLWLYQHNYYVKAFVDSIAKSVRFMVMSVITFVRDMAFAVMVVWGVMRTTAQVVWSAIVTAALVAWHLIQSYIVTPIQLAYQFVVAKLTALWHWLVGIWNTIVTLAKVAWQAFYNAVIAPVQRLWSGIQAVLGGFWKNISGWFGNLASAALNWGKNLIHMFVQGIKAAGGELWNTISGVGKGIAGFLGFHSPPPHGPLSDSHTYMPNMMRMFSQGIISGTPALALAAHTAAAALANGLNGGGSRATGSAASLAGAGLAGGGTVNHTWNVSFPNATDRREIKAALEDLQRDQNRLGRVGGYAGGLRKR